MTPLATPRKVQYETGTYLGTGSVLAQEMEFAAHPLASEKCADQNGEGYELPTQAGEQAEGYHKGDRRMDRKEPAGRKLPLVRPPVPEGKIKNKNKCCHGHNIHRCLPIHSMQYSTTEWLYITTEEITGNVLESCRFENSKTSMSHPVIRTGRTPGKRDIFREDIFTTINGHK